MTTIELVEQIDLTEVEGTDRTLTEWDWSAVDGDIIYVGYHLDYTGGEQKILKFNKSDKSHSALSLGTGFTSGTPILNYDDNYLVVALMTSSYSTIRLFIIDKSTFSVVRTLSFDADGVSGSAFGSAQQIFKRSDGGLRISYYQKNNIDDSARNIYVLNLNPVSDIVNDDITIKSHFLLGTVGEIVMNDNGVILYHPAQPNADINQSDFRFLLYTDDDTLETLYYGDGTSAPVPFTPDSADYSKVNSILSGVAGMKNGNTDNILLNDQYYEVGNDVNGYAGYELKDLDFNTVASKITSYSGFFVFYGSDTYLLLKTDCEFKLYKISDGSLIDIDGSYSPGPYYTFYNDGTNIYIFDSYSDYHVGRVSIFNTSDYKIMVVNNKKMFPFWLQ